MSERYELITRRLNLEYWGADSRIQHSIYAGSYGRGTATSRTSDVDMIFWLPYDEYVRFNGYSGNGQSALLYGVSKAIQKPYTVTKIGADGQVVVVPFDDGIVFEVLPAFVNKDDSFTYADTNGGGSWKTTNPRPEIEEIARVDKLCNGNLKTLAKMARAWKHVWSVDISGLLIDTLVYQFIRGYEYRDKSFLYYDYMSRDFFDFLSKQDINQSYWLLPGAGQYVWKKGSFQFKAAQCRNIDVSIVTVSTARIAAPLALSNCPLAGCLLQRHAASAVHVAVAAHELRAASERQRHRILRCEPPVVGQVFRLDVRRARCVETVGNWIVASATAPPLTPTSHGRNNLAIEVQRSTICSRRNARCQHRRHGEN